MRLIEWKAGEVVVAPETLLIDAFNKVYQEAESNEMGIKALGYIYLMASPASPYATLSDDAQRRKAVKEALGLKGGWKETYAVKKAIGYYEGTFMSTSAALLKDMRIVVDKMRKILRELDLDYTDASGRPDIKSVETVAKIVSAIPKMIKDLDEAEKAVLSDEKKVGRMRGSGEKALLEDGFDIIA